nr:MAG TPA: hypothetical protein [Caudoviricetes sp.]
MFCFVCQVQALVPEKISTLSGSYSRLRFSGKLVLYASEHLLSRCIRRKQTAAKANGIKKSSEQEEQKEKAQLPSSAPE